MRDTFIDPPWPPLRITRAELVLLCKKVAALWPDPLLCERKVYGIGDSYSCPDVTEAAHEVDLKIDQLELSEAQDEIISIIHDFVGKAIKATSRY